MKCYFDPKRKKIIGKPVKWESPEFLIDWDDYFGVSGFWPLKRKNRNYAKEIF